MKLRTVLENEGFLSFLDSSELARLNRLSVESYEKIENGFIVTMAKYTYKVLLEKHKTYHGADPLYQKNTYVYFKGRMGFYMKPMEKGYPKAVILLGHVLSRQWRATVN